MNIKIILSIILLTYGSALVIGQNRRLGKPEFETEIIDQWWSFENKELKKDCDMRIVVIKSTGFESNCVNWSAGFSGNKCGYELTITDNLFELKARACQTGVNPGFIYGYLSEDDRLFLLLSKKQLALSASLLSDKNWIQFEKIKR